MTILDKRKAAVRIGLNQIPLDGLKRGLKYMNKHPRLILTDGYITKKSGLGEVKV